MEFHRFPDSIIAIPAAVFRRARGTTVRIIGYSTGLDRLFGTWAIIERARFG